MIDAVLLLAFGGPLRPEDVRPFLANVTRGRPIPPERLELVAHHYAQIGGASPLHPITQRQAEALRRTLRRLPVFVGMRHWHPYIADTIAEMTAHGVRRALAIVLSPHASPASRDRYVEEVEAARVTLGPRAPTIVWAPAWHEHPGFIDAVADGVRAARKSLDPDRAATARLIFTAHSIPAAMAAEAPYEAQIRASAAAVATWGEHPHWQIAWQSRSGNPREPWLEPDVNVALETLRAEGVRDVIVSPIGFVCDHVEVLYDLDIEARATAARLGLGFARASAPNDHSSFIAMLADLARGALG